MAISISQFASFFKDEQKSLERGENHHQSGHIEQCSLCEGQLTDLVRASMRDKVYRVSVSIGDQGILSTLCECPRGEHKCSHEAALCIFAHHNFSRTDIECQWKKKPAAKQHQSVEELYPETKPYCSLTREANEDDLDWLRNRLKGRCNGMSWLLSPEPEQRQPLLSFSVTDIVARYVHQGLNSVLAHMEVTERQQEEIQAATTGQRHNPNWHTMRGGRLTASNFGAILRAKRVTPSLLSRVLGKQSLDGVHSVQWGIVNEKEGIKAFTMSTQMEVQESGLCLSRSGVLGASPDGLIGTDAVLEVKCPYGVRDMTIPEAMSRKDFYLKEEGGNCYLCQDHPYWHQVQGQLHITGRQTCYFVVWTTKDSIVISIPREDSWQANLKILEAFHKTYILPQLAQLH